MNDKISLQRIKLLLRADWIEHRTQVSFVIGSFLAAFIVFFLITLQGDATTRDFIRKQYFFYGLGLFGYFVYYCRYVGTKVHTPKGLFLTLPANTMEKFSALLLEGFILIAVFHLLLWLALYGVSLIMPNYSVISFFDIMYFQNDFADYSLFIFTAFPFLHNFPEACFSGGYSRLYLIIGRYVIYDQRISSRSIRFAERSLYRNDPDVLYCKLLDPVSCNYFCSSHSRHTLYCLSQT